MEQRDVVIVGAGFSGLYMLHTVRRLGLTARVFERGDGIGGTWYWNRYPGARCDVESLVYSYSFDDELQQEWEWTEKYPSQPEILRYVEHVADRYDLRRDITLNATVTEAHWDEAAETWTVRTESGDEVTARWCVMATGALSTAKLPEVDGIDDYRGDWYHTAAWPHEPVDFTGRRVAVIGTGSSGIQTIPVIAEQAAELTVFQRTANFSVPSGNRPLTAAEQADHKARFAQWRQAARDSLFGTPFPISETLALSEPEEERRRRYEAAWGESLTGLFLIYADTLADEAANEDVAGFIREKIAEKVSDPDTRELLTPRDHPAGTKRPCMDSDYFETFNADHVSLVDLRATPIERLTAEGLRTTERDYAFDAIVFATGFDAVTGSVGRIDVRGRGGRTVADKWADGPRTYLGLGMRDFPNLFMIVGPQSPSVLSNMLVSIEHHVEWIGALLAHALEHDVTVIEATLEAEDEWVAHIAELAGMTLWPRANSWYMGANVPGKPRQFMLYAGGVITYHAHCAQVAADGYRGFELSRSSERAPA